MRNNRRGWYFSLSYAEMRAEFTPRFEVDAALIVQPIASRDRTATSMTREQANPARRQESRPKLLRSRHGRRTGSSIALAARNFAFRREAGAAAGRRSAGAIRPACSRATARSAAQPRSLVQERPTRSRCDFVQPDDFACRWKPQRDEDERDQTPVPAVVKAVDARQLPSRARQPGRDRREQEHQHQHQQAEPDIGQRRA